VNGRAAASWDAAAGDTWPMEHVIVGASTIPVPAEKGAAFGRRAATACRGIRKAAAVTPMVVHFQLRPDPLTH
jgi:hypothetical protein